MISGLCSNLHSSRACSLGIGTFFPAHHLASKLAKSHSLQRVLCLFPATSTLTEHTVLQCSVLETRSYSMNAFKIELLNNKDSSNVNEMSKIKPNN